MTWWAFFFRLIPANFISFLTGIVVRLKFPVVLQRHLNAWFVRAFRIDLSEAITSDLSKYASIEDVFTRPLRSGLRPIQGHYVSPSDGIVSISLKSSKDQAIQVKGSTYSLWELVWGKEAPKTDTNFCWYSTVYLAPHNYHRVHAPFSGTLTRIRHIPGFLWSVNQTFLRAVPKLFNQNERLVFDFELKNGGRAHVVMVGAFNVGRMTTNFWPDFATNCLLQGSSGRDHTLKAEVAAGDELGTFLLGSTVVTVLDKNSVQELVPRSIDEPMAIKVGVSLS